MEEQKRHKDESKIETGRLERAKGLIGQSSGPKVKKLEAKKEEEKI